ncbi:radical SAM protein [Lysobacter sp. Root690]|uniref:radical SAM protein n=1 Tax=Lysobacter sp. Root690 TaxID=1736588 RepID=UPI0009EC2DE0|nr:radical SAM protein [Lysobacter sp. Root690]
MSTTGAAVARRLNVVFKITERCNLKCSYCYFFFSGDDSWKRHPPLVGLDVVRHLARFCKVAARDYGIERIALIFHGGEPLLMKRARFAEICDLLRAEEDGFAFDFGMQTNGALLNEEWVGLFERYRVSVGVSLDGTRDINDLHRLDMKGRSTYEQTVSGLRLLQAAARAGRIAPPGILSVINPEADGAATYRHFVDDLSVKNINFLSPDHRYDSGASADIVGGVERFMLSALREWLKDKDPSVRVRMYSEILAGLSDTRAAHQLHEFIHDYRNIVAVSSNGDLGPEDTLHGLDPRFVDMGMNVATHELSDLFQSGIWSEQQVAAMARPAACRDCDWWRICRGGKPANRYASINGFDNPSLYCNGLQQMYAEVGAFLVRNGMPIKDIVARLA